MEDKTPYRTIPTKQRICPNHNDTLVVGIDPDVKKSGFAVVSKTEKKVTMAESLPFFDLIEQLEMTSELCELLELKMLVVVEAGWKNKKSNFRTIKGAAGEYIAKNVGENHRVGKLFVEFCSLHEIECIEAKPLLKCWKGPNHKITQEELLCFATGTPAHTNQDLRDAILLAWTYANLPIKLNSNKGTIGEHK